MLPFWFTLSSRNITHQLENAEITPELCDGLTNFSFDDLQEILMYTISMGTARSSSPLF